MTAALIETEEKSLARCEHDIEIGITELRKHARMVGTALSRIKDDGLFKGEFETFDEYCLERWGFRKSRAYQLLNYVKILKTIGIREDDAPADKDETSPPVTPNERQARELAKAPMEIREEVWDEAVADSEATGEPVTASGVAMTVQRWRNREAWDKISGEFPAFASKVENGELERPPASEVQLVSKMAGGDDRIEAVARWADGKSCFPDPEPPPEPEPPAPRVTVDSLSYKERRAAIQGHLAEISRGLGTVIRGLEKLKPFLEEHQSLYQPCREALSTCDALFDAARKKLLK